MEDWRPHHLARDDFRGQSRVDDSCHLSPRSASERAVFQHQVSGRSGALVKGQAGWYSVQIGSSGDVARVSGEIDDMFRNSPLQTKTESEKAFQLGFVASLGNVKAFILGICGAVVFTIMLVSANTMAMSVRSRTREVALLKTLGFTRQRVLSIFVSESVALAVAGGVLGILVAIPVIWWLTRSFIALGVPLAMKVNLQTAGLSLLVALTLGLVSGYLPAFNASRMNIVEGLRHIG